MKKYLFFMAAFWTTAQLSAQTTNQVVASFEHKAGSSELTLGQTVFELWNGKKAVLTRAEFYVSEVDLHRPDGSNLPLTDKYILVNALDIATKYDLGVWEVGSIHGATLHLGVPQSVNHLDPAAYPADHPLAPKNPSMHWGWTAGYRFMAIEGKVDNNNDGVPETDFQFHNLGDALYKTIELTGMANASNDTMHLRFTLDYSQLFKNIAMTGNLIQHGSAALNTKMMTNAATENFISLPLMVSTEEVIDNSLNVRVFPNPANTNVWVEYELPSDNSLNAQVNNLLGQNTMNLSGLPAKGIVNLPIIDLPKGTFIISFFNQGQLVARKLLIVQH
ncbi:MAG: MbnP family protein [Saprospiraceae bacterium]|nr:MbnP family protein [Saprospiraceae bacterium]